MPLKKQAPLPANAFSGSVEEDKSSSPEASGDFVKIKQDKPKTAPIDDDNIEPNNNEQDEEEIEDEEQEGTEDDDEPSPLEIKTDALLDLFESLESFFEGALPELDVDRIAREQATKRHLLSSNHHEQYPPVLSISYIDKDIYATSEYIDFVSEMVELYVKKFDLLRESFKNNKNIISIEKSGMHFGAAGTCFFEFCGCDLGPENSQVVSNTLIPALARGCAPNGPNLTLRLDNNRLLKAGFDYLSKSITTTTTSASSDNSDRQHSGFSIQNVLKDLSVRENSIRDESMPQLCKLLHSCPHLEDLVIGTSHIFPSGIDILVKYGIQTSPYVFKNLKHLGVEFNTLGNQGILTLAKALSKCYALEKLNISDNSISDEGAVAVAEYLLPGEGCCGPLRWIDMSVNQIGQIGAEAIANALEKRNSRIEYLDIGCNPIGPEGGEALCRASKTAKRLMSLDLTTTDLTEKAGKMLIDALMTRPNVFNAAFIFECNQLSFEVRKKIAETMNSRRKLVVGEDEEFPRGYNLKKYGAAREKEVLAMMMNSRENTTSSADDEPINWTLIAGVLSMSSLAIWYLLKPKAQN